MLAKSQLKKFFRDYPRHNYFPASPWVWFGRKNRGSRKFILWPLLCCLFGAFTGINSAQAVAAQHLQPPATSENKLGMSLQLIPGGLYLMGSPPEEAGRYWHEDPQHKVHLSPFYMTDKEITNAQYGQFLTATGHATPLYLVGQKSKCPRPASGGCHLAGCR